MPTDIEIQGILREHHSVVLHRADATQRINVRRSQLLNDSLASFSCPMCEYTFVYSHSHCAMAGSLFQVSAGGLLSVHNVPALGKNTYKL